MPLSPCALLLQLVSYLFPVSLYAADFMMPLAILGSLMSQLVRACCRCSRICSTFFAPMVLNAGPGLGLLPCLEPASRAALPCGLGCIQDWSLLLVIKITPGAPKYLKPIKSFAGRLFYIAFFLFNFFLRRRNYQQK